MKVFAEEKNVSIKTTLIGFKINNKLQFCLFSVFSILEIALEIQTLRSLML